MITSRMVQGITLSLFILISAASTTVFAQQIAVRGETVYTMAGQPISDGVVLIRNGKIERVGSARQVNIPSGYQTLRAKVVTPGLIDARTVVGLSGYLNQPHDQMQLELSASIQPELRAIDAYNAQEKLVEWLRQYGITTVQTGHAPGALSVFHAIQKAHPEQHRVVIDTVRDERRHVAQQEGPHAHAREASLIAEGGAVGGSKRNRRAAL